MKIAAIIAEYNPYHNGHRLLVRQVRSAGAQAVIAVMGGDWLQRGEPALFPKRIRARAALTCGVDLVLELPLPYAAATAERRRSDREMMKQSRLTATMPSFTSGMLVSIV